MLLNDFIQAIFEVEEGRRAERNKQTQLHKILKEDGDNIKILFVQRERRRHHILATDDNNGERGATDLDKQSSPKHRAKKMLISTQKAAELHDEKEEGRQLLQKQLELQRAACCGG